MDNPFESMVNPWAEEPAAPAPPGDGFADDSMLPDTLGGFNPAQMNNPFSQPEPAPAAAEAVDPEAYDGDSDTAFTKGIKSGYYQTVGLGGALAALAGEAFNSDTMREFGLESYQDNMDRANEIGETTVTSYADVEGFDQAAEYLAYGIGNVISQFAPTILAGGVGGLAGRAGMKTAAKKLLNKELEKGEALGLDKDAALDAAQKAAEAKIKKGEWLGATGAGATAGFGLATGEIGGSIYDNTGKLEPGVAASFGAASGVLDAFVPLKILNRMGVGKKFVKDLEDSAIKDVLISSSQESMTESAQFMLEEFANKWVDENYEILDESGREELINSGIMGFLGGGVITGGSRAVGGLLEQDQDAMEREARGLQLQQSQQIEREARAAGDAARARGADELEAQLAEQQVYLDGEAVRGQNMMPFEGPNMPVTDTPDGTVNFNPYQQQMEQPVSYDAQGNPVVPQEAVNPYAPPEPGPIPFESQPEPQGQSFELQPMDQAPDSMSIDLEQPDRTAELAGNIEAQVEENNYRDIGLDAEQPETEIAPLDNEPQISAMEEVFTQEKAEIDEDRAQAETMLPEKIKSNSPPSPEMELKQAIAALGGLSRDEAAQQGIDPAEFGRQSLGIKYLFSKKGKTFDEMAESLNELGFFQGEDGYSANGLLEKLSRSLGGDDVLSANAVGPVQEAMVGAELDEIDQREQALLQQFEIDQDDPPAYFADRMGSDEAGISYDVLEAEDAGASDAEIQAAFEADTLGEARTNLRKLINEGRTRQKADVQRSNEGREGNQEAPQRSQAQESQESLLNEVNEEQGDLFGITPEEQTTGQLQQAQDQKDQSRNPGTNVPADVDGGLFSNQDQQVDIEDAPSSGIRAKAGGERGVNGEWYEGGKFLPSNAQRAKGSPAKRKKGGGKTLIEPGVLAQAPTGYVGLFQSLNALTEPDGSGNIRLIDNDTAIEYYGGREQLQERVDAYNNGMRFFRIDSESSELPPFIAAETDTGNQVNADRLNALVDAKKADQEKRAAQKALKEKTFTEEVQDEDGNTLEITETGLDRLRDYDKRMKMLDKLMGCMAA